MNQKSRALIFGDEALAYDRHRPRYPVGSIDHVLGLTDVSRAVEIGAGTGIATAQMVRPGLEILCLEPSAAMAGILRSRGLAGVTVEVTTFEDWENRDGSADLIYAAQAWHWVDPTTSYDKAKRVLRPGGAIALMWNVPLDRYQHFRSVYEEHAPAILAENDRRIQKRDGDGWERELRSAGFYDVQVAMFDWEQELDAAGFCALRATYSDHMMLPDDQRARLLAALHDAVDECGGKTTFRYQTRVFSGIA